MKSLQSLFTVSIVMLGMLQAKAQSGASGANGTYLNVNNYVNSERTAGGDFDVDANGYLEIGTNGVLEILGAVSNKGTIEVDSNGILSIYGDINNAGTIILHKGATVNFYGTKWANATIAKVIDGATINTVPGGNLNFIGARPAVPASWTASSPYLAAYSGGTRTQFSDGGNVPMDVTLRLQNANGLALINTATKIEGELQYVSNGNIFLGNNDLNFTTNATQSGFNAERYAVTAGNGHVSKENYTGEWIFAVGKDVNDYTPAAITNVTANTMHVAVEDYTKSAAIENTDLTVKDGMDRTWNIFADNAGGVSTINLQHNSATNQTDFNEGSSYVTRWSDVNPNNTGDRTSTTAWQRNLPSAGAAGNLSWAGAIIDGSNMNNRTYRDFATIATAAAAYYTKSSESFKVKPAAQILVFNADSIACQEAAVSFTTGKENNIVKFQLQHSIDGKTYTTITTFDPKGDNSTYSYEHITAVEGTNYYRLAMLDANGDYSVSQTVTTVVDCSQQDPVVILYPNPARDFVKIAGLSGKSQVRILNMHGRVMSELSTSNSIETIDISMLPAAPYVAEVLTSVKRNITAIKFIKY
ncbi:MAG: T9SS type A sorting domain-containing protein [Chitinophagaceae bacterium]|nr:T9SS type A sorting domain-containing protein [Chitinophagaceae bacterium]